MSSVTTWPRCCNWKRGGGKEECQNIHAFLTTQVSQPCLRLAVSGASLQKQQGTDRGKKGGAESCPPQLLLSEQTNSKAVQANGHYASSSSTPPVCLPETTSHSCTAVQGLFGDVSRHTFWMPEIYESSISAVGKEWLGEK